MTHRRVAVVLSALMLAACSPRYDVVIRNGTIYDGSGGEPYVGDLAIAGDSIVAVGTVTGKGRTEIDATDLAVSPGFINVIAHPEESLIADGRGMSDILQGVTLEIMGEGESMGPWNDSLKAYAKAHEGDIKYDIPWTTCSSWWTRVSHPTSPHSLAPPPSARTCWDSPIGIPHPTSWSRCRRSSARPWKTVRSGSPRR